MMCGACWKSGSHSDGYSLVRIYYDTKGMYRHVVLCPVCTSRALSSIGVDEASLRMREATE